MQKPLGPMRAVLDQFSYLAALIRANWITHLLGFRRTLMLGGMMFVQNLIFFAMWIVFFHSVDEVKSWKQQDVAVLFGSVNFIIGTALFFFDGARMIGYYVLHDALDSYLTKPRQALPAILLSRSNAASLGDIISGPFYWFVFGGKNLRDLPFLMGICVPSVVIAVSIMVLFFSIIFWRRNAGHLSNQLTDMMVIVSATPQHGQSFGLKAVLFSVLPAGFIGLAPASLMRDFNPLFFLGLVLCSVVYAAAALWVFRAGLNRYRRDQAERAL